MTTQTMMAEPTVQVETDGDRRSLIATAVIACSYLPLLYLHGVQLWGNTEYQYFPFVLAAVGYLMWTRFRCAEKLDAGPLKLMAASSLVVIAWVLLVLSLLTYTTWLAYLSALAMSAAVFVVLAQQYRITNLWGIWLLLALISPFPYYVHQSLVQYLQALSSRLSSQVLDLYGINHIMEGNVLRLPDKEFFVDEACSGVVSVMAVVAAAAIYAVWKNRSLLHVALLLASGVLGAVVMNVVRISSISVVHAKWGLDWSTGVAHEVLGFTTFSGAFIGMVSVDCILNFLLDPIVAKSDGINSAVNPLVRTWNRFVTLWSPRKPVEASPDQRTVRSLFEAIMPAFNVGTVAILAFGALAVVQSATLARAILHTRPDLGPAMSLGNEFLPDEIHGFRKQEFEAVERSVGNEYGDFSKIFTYVNARTGQPATVSFDFPFNRGWHELSVCYLSSGWTMASRDIRSEKQGETSEDWNYVSASFSKPTGEHGYLVFSSFDEEGNAISPPAATIWEKVWRRLWHRNPNVLSNRMLQLQVWTQADQPMDDTLRTAVNELMLEIRPAFLGRFRDGESNRP